MVSYDSSERVSKELTLKEKKPKTTEAEIKMEKQNTACEICNVILNQDLENILSSEQHKIVCLDCATKLAVDGAFVSSKDDFEEWKLCKWCDGLFPESDLKEETDMGLLCDTCISAILSRGESLTFEE